VCFLSLLFQVIETMIPVFGTMCLYVFLDNVTHTNFELNVETDLSNRDYFMYVADVLFRRSTMTPCRRKGSGNQRWPPLTRRKNLRGNEYISCVFHVHFRLMAVIFDMVPESRF